MLSQSPAKYGKAIRSNDNPEQSLCSGGGDESKVIKNLQIPCDFLMDYLDNLDLRSPFEVTLVIDMPKWIGTLIEA